MAEFLDTELLLKVAQAIADLRPCPYHHRLTRDQIVIALADHDIFPEAVRADMIVDAVEQAEIKSNLAVLAAKGNPQALLHYI